MNRQVERLTPQFQRLQDAMEQRRVTLQDNPLGLQPELALVLEIVGSVGNFIGAVRRVQGLEWLGEFTLTNIPPDDDFVDERDPQRQLSGQLFLTMSDQRALDELRRLFVAWQENPAAPFERGYAPLKHVFEHLRTIRPWGIEDRLRETGIFDMWQSELENDSRVVNFEAELWFRADEAERQMAGDHLRNIVQNLDGEFIQQCVIQEIGYHAVLGRIPASRVPEIMSRREVRLLQCEGMMYLRPVGQFAVPTWTDDLSATEAAGEVRPLQSSLGEPVVALLDGMPLVGHQLLQDWITIDDPDGYDASYQADERRHGTGMASLICHGELEEQSDPLTRRLYVRPILQPRRDFRGQFEENIPANVLPVDLIHRAVRRLYEQEGGQHPVAPSVRVINFSVGDPSRPLESGMSSLARLLDWLAYKHNVLFIVSAGNHLQDIELDILRSNLNTLSAEGRLKAVVKAIAADTRQRRLLSPAETLNGLTIGSEHGDASTPVANLNLIDPFQQTTGSPSPGSVTPNASQRHESVKLPSVVSAHGPGYRRSIKPDFSLPGGRQFLIESLGNSHPNALLQVSSFSTPAWPAGCNAWTARPTKSNVPHQRY